MPAEPPRSDGREITERRRAAFLDRDGTIIADRHYLGDPEGVELAHGAARAIGALNRAGVAAIVVTNQSGIGRGYFTRADFVRVSERVDAVLAAHGAWIDATYMCPHTPEEAPPCPCRKPGLMLFRRAIAEHDLDAARSVFIGDRWRDVEPAQAFGARAILVPTSGTAREDVERAQRDAEVAGTVEEAVARYLGVSGV